VLGRSAGVAREGMAKFLRLLKSAKIVYPL